MEEHRISGLLTVRVAWWDYVAMVSMIIQKNQMIYLVSFIEQVQVSMGKSNYMF